jgi:molybdate transport system substrate-binding protein
MTAFTSSLVEICSAGAGRVWIEQCLAMPQWAPLAQYRSCFAALQSTLDEVNRRLEEGQDCHLCVLTPDAIRSLQSRWPERIDGLGSLGQAETGLVALAGDGQTYDVATVQALRNTLMSLDVLLVPDLLQSSGGRHLQRVLDQLALSASDMPTVQSYPGGAQAVAALPAHAGQRVLACAQSTEVQTAPHAHYLGPFPAPHGLSTEYAVAVVRPHPSNHDPEAQTAWSVACDLARYLCSPDQQARRLALGFAAVS